MNNVMKYPLKVLKKAYIKLNGNINEVLPECDQNPDSVSETIMSILLSPQPCMIGRFGSTELACLCNYFTVKSNKKNIFNYIQGKSQPWWWEESIINQMMVYSGFFPAEVDSLARFGELMLADIPEVDILGSWQRNELYFEKELAAAKKIQLMYLDPYWSKVPWTKVLKGKNILVVHPFAETIKEQYKNRKLLFENEDTLPEFKSLQVIKAVQSLGGEDNQFDNWFEALDYMKSEIDKCEFDICLIGCGAYGFPLAAHVKRLGKKAVHVGGSLQLLFGIRGKRWESDAAHKEGPHNVFIHYSGLPNKYWVRPSEGEKPKNHDKVEDSCYW